MREIEAENIVASYFVHHPEKNDVDFAQLNNIKSWLESAFQAQNLVVYVWATKKALFTMIENYPKLFERRGNRIHLIDRGKLDEFSLHCNVQLDSTIKDTYFQLMETLCQKE